MSYTVRAHNDQAYFPAVPAGSWLVDVNSAEKGIYLRVDKPTVKVRNKPVHHRVTVTNLVTVGKPQGVQVLALRLRSGTP